jgi:hypothetical protein
MKSKRSKNKLVVMLNKQTIANLNHREMVKIAGGTDKTEKECPETKEKCTEKPEPTDFGITPFLQSGKQVCY